MPGSEPLTKARPDIVKRTTEMWLLAGRKCALELIGKHGGTGQDGRVGLWSYLDVQKMNSLACYFVLAREPSETRGCRMI